jgi:phosphoribosylglycinamide formyltransferase-1
MSGDAAKPFRIAVLISGGGTTLRNLIAQRDAGKLPVEIALVISSNPQAGGLEIAANAGIPTFVVPRRTGEASGTLPTASGTLPTASGTGQTPEQFRDAIFGPCRDAGVDLVVMGGFLKHVLIPPDFENRVVNIHPSLIPSFCGQGFYGLRVHEAVLESGTKVTGCTVHYVDNEYDHGPIILQRKVPVLDDDTPESLAARVFAAECETYPQAIREIAAQRAK